MAIIPVMLRRKGSSPAIRTYAFLDPGSSVSFITDSMKQKLGCEGKRLKITLETMGHPHSMITYSINHLEIDSEIGILIGNTVPDAYSPLHVKRGPQGSPHATFTRLGWVVCNVVRHTPVNRADITAIQEIEELKKLGQLVQQSINYDFPERVIDDKRQPSHNDIRFLEKVKESITLNDGHYTIPLPFKSDSVCLPDNHYQAYQRLMNLKQKMKRNDGFLSDYKDFINNILEKNYAEKVSDDELKRDDGKVWFIPHHGVYHPHKPDKIRVVFDCAATHQGTALNNLLLQGPDLTNSLIGVLMRFRQEPVALMADIESMVRVPRDDRDFLRFYWWPDGDLQSEPAVYRMCVHLFGAVSSPSFSTAALRQTAEDNREMFNPLITNVILRSFYVDDLLKSVENEDIAKSIVTDVSELCARGGGGGGGFRVTKWMSNRHTVVESIQPNERAKSLKSIDLKSDQLPVERALSVTWSVEKDCFQYTKVKDKQPTRRGILSMVSSVYEPLGYVSPYVLVAKILLQKLCRDNVEWDKEISGDDMKIWREWLNGLSQLNNIKLPRCFKTEEFGSVVTCQLHMFSDASDHGYGVVAYLRLINSRNEIHVSFVMGKSRVAPLKRVTIPRMELTTATIAMKLGKMIIDELEYIVTETFYWTDSWSVLRYIASDTNRFHTFVANRVQIIRESSDKNQWNYIHTKSNPADAASRGMKVNKFLQADIWFKAPDFLRKPESEWQVNSNEKELILPADDPEVKRTVATTTFNVAHYSPLDNRLIGHYSDWTRL
ncbi:uncharacterized protein LOC124136493 [Haliotis rufescens]|uniref:uncharacterized protein LOC124136493 n=1 Tax=Haliotis rufescens TaxID=6454 RepID=UPI00201F21B9|nr:uncharacterized protein LOC124136493 [Haliotis rufescens]